MSLVENPDPDKFWEGEKRIEDHLVHNAAPGEPYEVEAPVGFMELFALSHGENPENNAFPTSLLIPDEVLAENEKFEATPEQIEQLFCDEKAKTTDQLLLLLQVMAMNHVFIRVNGHELPVSQIHYQFLILKQDFARLNVSLSGESDIRWSNIMHLMQRGTYANWTANQLCSITGRTPEDLLLRMLGVLKRELLSPRTV